MLLLLAFLAGALPIILLEVYGEMPGWLFMLWATIALVTGVLAFLLTNRFQRLLSAAFTVSFFVPKWYLEMLEGELARSQYHLLMAMAFVYLVAALVKIMRLHDDPAA